jgi:phage tail sheath protein FI
MMDYFTPGVHIEEKPATGPIQGIGTSTAAFIGKVAGGNTDLQEVTNWSQYKRYFSTDEEPPSPYSGDSPPCYLAHAVEGFFRNGGTRAYILPLGNEDLNTKLERLARITDVNIVCYPGCGNSEGAAIINHCEEMGDRFAILDSKTDDRASLTSKDGFAALYYPWIKITDPENRENQIEVPPSGHIAGVYARSDAKRGVHKAPANEMIRGAVGLRGLPLNKIEIGELNKKCINVIRTFPNRATPTIWGARTLIVENETAWRYVNVRRLMLFIEKSIEEGIRWAVFEPNNQDLWKKLIRTISEFLNRVWRSGALFGETAEDAFYVKCDEELNDETVRALGQVVVEIGVALVEPAEFVVIRIGQWDGGSETTET